ncbi:MAG: hypothetical protein IT331_23320 [Anaerolineae bacterium]|nr:hypothetical protein [Anaerolineae bacterium]
MPRKSMLATPPLFPNNARAGLVFTDDGQIIYCSQNKHSIQRKGLSPETVASVFIKAPVWSGFLPPDVWCWGKADGAEWLALCIPASVHTLLLADDNNAARFTVPMPPVIFAGTRLEYYIWAVGDKAWTRDPRVAAFHAPFPNVNEKGLVCFGTNILPPCSPQTILDAWQIFLNSPFNNHNIENKSKQYPQDIRELWRALSKQNILRFPCDDLMPIGNSIGRELERALMRNY